MIISWYLIILGDLEKYFTKMDCSLIYLLIMDDSCHIEIG